ncbi:MAG: methyltransferase domain-containing protein [Myxococcales bacterium]|nr:methyltransferase domain-containing protein [Myxococcales bacterium]
MNTDAVRENVQDYYGRVLARSADLQTNACCATGAPPARIARLLENVHPDVLDRFYGCGFPFPEALEGATVVDLGCGTGRDVFVLSQLVGPTGHVHGVDMTAEQLDVARQTLDWHMERFGYSTPNVTLHQGYIEDLSAIADASVDVVVSNCVVNLSPFKDRVMAEIARILKPGGEFYFSDVFADRRLPDAIAFDPILHAECLGGAMYEADFLSLARRTGFPDPRQVSRGAITIQNPEIEARVGAARFTSVTLRLLKLAGLDEQCEDYGQIAVYRGTLPTGALFHLDDHHTFEAGRPERVCGNTAAMLTDTRFAPHFDVVGDKRVHYGIFDCGPTMAAAVYATGAETASCC